MTEKRRAPIRSAELDLENYGFPGWKVTVRTNPHWGVIEDMTAQDMVIVREALSTVVLDWNFVDEEGEPLVLPQEDQSVLRRVPTDIIQALLGAYLDKVTEVPNQSRPR